MTKITFRQEILRKLVHLSSMWIPVAIYHMDKKRAFILFSVLSGIMFLIETGRRRWELLDKVFTTILGQVLRDTEKGENKNFTGGTYMLFSAAVTIALFPTLIAVTGFSLLIISDTAAALAGRRWGRHPIMDKSLEGSLAFFLSALFVIFFLGVIITAPYSFYITGIAGAASGTIAELFSTRLRIDDNLTIPFASGITILLANNLIN